MGHFQRKVSSKYQDEYLGSVSETWRVRVKIFEDLDRFKSNSFSMMFESWKNQLLKSNNVSFVSTNVD